MKKNSRLHWQLSPVTERLRRAQTLDSADPLSQNTRKRRRKALATTLGLALTDDDQQQQPKAKAENDDDPMGSIMAEVGDLQDMDLSFSDPPTKTKGEDPFDSLLDEIAEVVEGHEPFPFPSSEAPIPLSSSNFPFPSSDLQDIEDLLPPIEQLPQQPWYRLRVISQEQNHVFNCQSMEGVKTRVIVRDGWSDLLIASGDYLHLVQPLRQGIELLVDAQHGFLIVHPDVLISCTTVADALGCLRRACLSLLVPQDIKRTGTAVLTVGSIVHDLYERSLLQGRITQADLDQWLPPMLTRMLPQLIGTPHDEKWVEGEIRRLCLHLPSWIDLHLRPIPHPQARVLEEGRGLVRPIALSKLEACEENVWCHAYGLKGKIDATVRVNDQDQAMNVLAPLELKTGQLTTAIAHRAQTLLYTLMLADRYGEEVPAGLLHYLATGQLIRLAIKRDIISDLLMNRNRLAQAIVRARQAEPLLPDPIQNDHVCGKCFQQTTCLTYRLLAEAKNDGPLKSSEAHSQLADLPPNHAQWFRQWERLVTLEEAEALNSRQQLWRQPLSERVQKGTTLLDLVLTSQDNGDQVRGEDEEEDGEEDGFRVKASLQYHGQCSFGEGDAIVLSAGQQYGLAIGFVEAVTGQQIQVRLDRPVRISSGLRLDRDELLSGFGLLRANLIRLFTPEATSLRPVVVDCQEPIESEPSPFEIKPTALLDDCQLAAITTLLERQPSYALLLGMPGTGKTTCLVQLLLQLMKAGQRVLLTSHTHAAVDNVLARLLEAGGDAQRMARLGNASRIVEPTVKPLAWQGRKWPGGLNEMRQAFGRQLVVAVTCMGINQ